VVLYRGSWIMALEWRLRRKKLNLPFIGMPNIIAGRLIVRELLQEAADAKAIADELISLLTDTARAAAMQADLAEITAVLGTPGAVERTARLAHAMIQSDWSPERLTPEVVQALQPGVPVGASS
jgi:lipid-A-disaccharide synthase